MIWCYCYFYFHCLWLAAFRVGAVEINKYCHPLQQVIEMPLSFAAVGSTFALWGCILYSAVVRVIDPARLRRGTDSTRYTRLSGDLTTLSVASQEMRVWKSEALGPSRTCHLKQNAGHTATQRTKNTSCYDNSLPVPTSSIFFKKKKLPVVIVLIRGCE